MAYDYKEHSASVTAPRSPEPLYRRRPWVPRWLWRWVAEPDLISHLESAMHEAQEQQARKLWERL